MKNNYEDPNEYLVLLYSPIEDGNAECTLMAVTISVKVDPKKKLNYGLIERKAREFLSPMGTNFRVSKIRAVGNYPIAGYD